MHRERKLDETMPSRCAHPIETRQAGDNALVGCEKFPLFACIAHVERAGVLDADRAHHWLSFVQGSPKIPLYRLR